MRWGFIGIGRVTHRMVEAVRAAGHQVAWGAGRDPHKLAQWQQRFNVPNVSTDFREVIVSETVDAIYVALPPSLHATWAIAALEHGKRVLCEKALASDEAQANLILAAVLRTGIPLVDATAFPHHPRSDRKSTRLNSSHSSVSRMPSSA